MSCCRPPLYMFSHLAFYVETVDYPSATALKQVAKVYSMIFTRKNQ
ncbi:Uncharacterised protein [BD1-7 clade bacterium]|uniref:Uncharacterized protein n=1 Tax=BD1-7 clade bacterium TaxID=2029982 RepID=A0A5S9NQ89_9GAMM|nr:Uncharacterised protein [BD1-7 clade bacterium]